MELLYIYNTTIDFSHHMININFICLYFSITYKIPMLYVKRVCKWARNDGKFYFYTFYVLVLLVFLQQSLLP